MATYRLVIELSFNSRPHAEVDSHNSGLSKTLPTFNSRPHAEVDSGLEGEFTTDFFQLTTSRRGRRTIFIHTIIIIFFQLTTSRRGRPSVYRCGRRARPFNSRPHAEVDNGTEYTYKPANSFNSRPHAEVDATAPALLICLSFFQLTTSRRGRRENYKIRMQILDFQLTTSRRGRLPPLGYKTDPEKPFNSRPHAEVDNV